VILKRKKGVDVIVAVGNCTFLHTYTLALQFRFLGCFSAWLAYLTLLEPFLLFVLDPILHHTLWNILVFRLSSIHTPILLIGLWFCSAFLIYDSKFSHAFCLDPMTSLMIDFSLVCR